MYPDIHWIGKNVYSGGRLCSRLSLAIKQDLCDELHPAETSSFYLATEKVSFRNVVRLYDLYNEQLVVKILPW